MAFFFQSLKKTEDDLDVFPCSVQSGMLVFQRHVFLLLYSFSLTLLMFLLSGRKNPHPLDCARGHRVQEVHVSQRRLELWHCNVGSHGIWREALLGHEQP